MSYKQETFAEKTIGFAFGYAKDLCTAGKCGIQDIEKYARQMHTAMNKLHDEVTGVVKPPQSNSAPAADPVEKQWLNPKTDDWDLAVSRLKAGNIKVKDLFDTFKISKANKAKLEKFEA